MDHDSTMTSFIDLIFILLIATMMITVLLAMQQNQKAAHDGVDHRLTPVDMTTHENDDQAKGDQPGETDLFLSVKENGDMFIEGGGLKQAKPVKDIPGLTQALQTFQPSKLYLRVDRGVPTGKTEKLLLTCSDLGILPFFVTAKPRED